MRNVNRCLLVFVLLTIDCASQQQQVSPLQRAELAYVETSIAYDAAMDLVVTARARHLVSDAAWHDVDLAQLAVARQAPLVRSMLSTWKATGEKPSGLDLAMLALTTAKDTVAGISKGKQP